MRRTEGIAGLWSGSCSSLILTINPAIQFMTYEAMKRQMQSVYGSRELNSLVVFGVGAVAKAVATVLTYPVQLVQAKQRVRLHFDTKKSFVKLLKFVFYRLKTAKYSSMCVCVYLVC